MSDHSLQEQLQTKITSIKSKLDQRAAAGHPTNEADTERILIEPLLDVLGYEDWEIVKRGHDNVAHSFPDYTLLPNTPHKWFLEAKKLDLSLQDGEAAQAVNYANNQGAEWALLTNGRTWYIYNAHLPKPLTEKRVFQINDLFTDDDAAQKLSLLSRESMQTGKLTEAWKRERVAAVIKEQMQTPNSTVRIRLREIIKKETNLPLTDTLIGETLNAMGLALNKDVQPIENAITAKTASAPEATSLSSSETVEGSSYTFAQIVDNPSLAVKHRPKELHFADGRCIKVTTWADAAKAVVEEESTTRALPPLPFSGGRKGKNYFLNTSPTHSNGNKMLHYREAEIGDTHVFIDTNRSAVNFSQRLIAFLKAIDSSVDGIKVSIQ